MISLYNTIKNKIKYVIAFILLLYISYLYIKNKGNIKKLETLRNKIDKLNINNVALSNSNNSLINQVKSLIINYDKMIQIEKDISKEKGKTDNAIKNAIEQYESDIDNRKNRIDALKNKDIIK